MWTVPVEIRLCGDNLMILKSWFKKVTKAKSYNNACTKHACIEYVIVSYKKIELVHNLPKFWLEKNIKSMPVPNIPALDMLLFHMKNQI